MDVLVKDIPTIERLLYQRIKDVCSFKPISYDATSIYFNGIVRLLFSLLPSTSVIIEVDSHLLVSIPVKFPDIERALLCMVNDMKTKKIIAGFSHAGYLFYQKH